MNGKTHPAERANALPVHNADGEGRQSVVTNKSVLVGKAVERQKAQQF